MHEIVTLQFGQQSNYLGTHFWNTQESYFTYGGEEESPVDHDIHFRPGVGADGGDTFMPRAVIYDLKGAFGSMRKINALYEVEEEAGAAEAVLWNGSTLTQRAPAIRPSDYQQHLDAGLAPPPLTADAVRYWSDYSRVYYHPKSLVQVHEYELSARLMPFEAWDAGEELFTNLDREHDLLDRDLRPFIEECDQLQGLQLMSGVDDAWGGFSARYVERLRDDFGKLSIWVWALEEEEKKTRDKKLLQIANKARSIDALAAQASAYVPVSCFPSRLPPYLSIDPSSRWHTAGLQAAAIESMTLPSRLRASSRGQQLHSFAEMEAIFNNDGNRKIAELQMSVADPHELSKKLGQVAQKEGANTKERKGFAFEDAEGQGPTAFDMDLSDIGPEQQQRGGRRKKVHMFGRVESLRGDWDVDEKIEAQNVAARDRFTRAPMVQRYRAPLLFPALDSFPPIFNVNATRADKLAVQASLSTTSSISSQLRQMGGLVGRLVGVDEREALSNGLKTMAEEYEEGWESGLEESDDDD